MVRGQGPAASCSLAGSATVGGCRPWQIGVCQMLLRLGDGSRATSANRDKHVSNLLQEILHFYYVIYHSAENGLQRRGGDLDQRLRDD